MGDGEILCAPFVIFVKMLIALTTLWFKGNIDVTDLAAIGSRTHAREFLGHVHDVIISSLVIGSTIGHAQVEIENDDGRHSEAVGFALDDVRTDPFLLRNHLDGSVFKSRTANAIGLLAVGDFDVVVIIATFVVLFNHHFCQFVFVRQVRSVGRFARLAMTSRHVDVLLVDFLGEEFLFGLFVSGFLDDDLGSAPFVSVDWWGPTATGAAFRFSFSLSFGFRGHDQFAEVVSVVVSVVVGVVDVVMGFGVVNVMGLEVVRFVLMIFVMMIMMSVVVVVDVVFVLVVFVDVVMVVMDVFVVVVEMVVIVGVVVMVGGQVGDVVMLMIMAFGVVVEVSIGGRMADSMMEAVMIAAVMGMAVMMGTQVIMSLVVVAFVVVVGMMVAVMVEMMAMMVKVVAVVAMMIMMPVMVAVMMSGVVVVCVVGGLFVGFRSHIVTCYHFDLFIFGGFSFVSLLRNDHGEGALNHEEKDEGRGQKTFHREKSEEPKMRRKICLFPKEKLVNVYWE